VASDIVKEVLAGYSKKKKQQRKPVETSLEEELVYRSKHDLMKVFGYIMIIVWVIGLIYFIVSLLFFPYSPYAFVPVNPIDFIDKKPIR